MKRIGFFIACMLFGITFVFAQGKPEMKISETIHDFGEVLEENGDVSCEFIVTNAGDAPLEIQNVTAGCGCTTPVWTKTPITPGQTGAIKVTYRVKGTSAIIDRDITITSNASETPFIVKIKGRVKRNTEQQQPPQPQPSVSMSSAPVDLQLQETVVNPDARQDIKKDVKKRRRR